MKTAKKPAPKTAAHPIAHLIQSEVSKRPQPERLSGFDEMSPYRPEATLVGFVATIALLVPVVLVMAIVFPAINLVDKLRRN